MVAASGGVGVVSNMQVTDHEVSHRTAVAHVGACCRGGIHMISGWLHHTEGLTARNLALLDEWANIIRNLRGPWIVAADWNCTPTEISEALWIEKVHGVVVAPG